MALWFDDGLILTNIPQALLQTYANTLEISLYSIALSDNFSDDRCGGYLLTRLKMLESCLVATKALLHQLSNLPLRVRIYTPYTSWSQSIQALVMLSRLSLWENETWKEIYNQHAKDFTEEIDIMIENFSEIQALNQAEGSRMFVPEAYLRVESRLKLMKEIHERIKASQAERALDFTDSLLTLGLGELLPMPMFDLLDGEFSQQVW